MTRFLQILTKTIISSLDPNSSVINSFFFVSLPVSYPFNFNTFHQTSFFIKCNAFFFTKQTYYSICMLNNYIVILVQLIIIAKITRIRLNNSTRITLKMCTFHRKKNLTSRISPTTISPTCICTVFELLITEKVCSPSILS